MVPSILALLQLPWGGESQREFLINAFLVSISHGHSVSRLDTTICWALLRRGSGFRRIVIRVFQAIFLGVMIGGQCQLRQVADSAQHEFAEVTVFLASTLWVPECRGSLTAPCRAGQGLLSEWGDGGLKL